MKKLGTILILLLVGAGLAFAINLFLPQDDEALRAAEERRDSIQGAYDVLSSRISDSLDVVRAQVIDSLAQETQEAEERIVYIEVEREATTTVRDSSMSSLIEAISIDAPHLTEGALAVNSAIQHTDSLFQAEIVDLRLIIRNKDTEIEQWKSDFGVERDARLLAEGVISADSAVIAQLNDRLDRKNKINLGLFEIPEWVGYVVVGGASFYLGTKAAKKD